MSLPFEEHRRGLLILDTGPIRELVLFHAVDQLRFERLRNDLRFVKDRGSYAKCGDFIAPFRKKATSASVVAELYYWIRNTERAGQARLWSRVYEEFRGMGMDEEAVRLLDMDTELVARFGPVDVSLIELARLHAERNPVILTMDRDFQGECMRAGLQALHVHEVLMMG